MNLHKTQAQPPIDKQGCINPGQHYGYSQNMGLSLCCRVRVNEAFPSTRRIGKMKPPKGRRTSEFIKDCGWCMRYLPKALHVVPVSGDHIYGQAKENGTRVPPSSGNSSPRHPGLDLHDGGAPAFYSAGRCGPGDLAVNQTSRPRYKGTWPADHLMTPFHFLPQAQTWGFTACHK